MRLSGGLIGSGVFAAILLQSGCVSRTTVTGPFVIRSGPSDERCPMTWVSGDYWELVAWAILADPSAAPVFAMAAGYPPDSLPSPGDRVTLPLSPDMEEALERRLSAARLVRDASALHGTANPESMELLVAAIEMDPEWSVPRTNLALLHLESGDRQAAVSVLAPVAHKYTPALLLATLDWEEGLTWSALSRISEAMSEPDPPPETLAAAGIIYSVTGDSYLAAQAWQRILSNPDAPSHLRLLAMEMLLRE